MAQGAPNEVHRFATKDQRFPQDDPVAKDYVGHPVNRRCFLTYLKQIDVLLLLGAR